jgi:hypothetical protein
MIGLVLLCRHKEIQEQINGSWTQALANFYGVTEPINGSWIQAIAEESFGLTEAKNGSWVQAIVETLGATEPINGDWYLAWFVQDGGVLVQPYWDINYVDLNYIINS